MYKILAKYGFITILPFEDTFFYATSLPKDIKFSQELLRLNYLKYSPYQNSNILSILKNRQLMLWFHKTSVASPIIMPESYILFKELKNRNQNAIYIIHDRVIKVLVIKDSQLLSSFTLDALDDATIALSRDEYQVSKVIKINKAEYEELKRVSLNKLTLKELYEFNQLELDRKTILNSFVEKASYPLSALVVFAIFVSYIQSSFLQKEIDDLKKTYTIEKDKNRDIKHFIKEHNSQVEKYQDFTKKELMQVEPLALLKSVYTIFKDDEKAYLIDVSVSENKMLLKIQTDVNPVVFLNRLNEIKYFSRVVIQNTHKPKKEMKIISYDLDVKMIKDI